MSEIYTTINNNTISNDLKFDHMLNYVNNQLSNKENSTVRKTISKGIIDFQLFKNPENKIIWQNYKKWVTLAFKESFLPKCNKVLNLLHKYINKHLKLIHGIEGVCQIDETGKEKLCYIMMPSPGFKLKSKLLENCISDFAKTYLLCKDCNNSVGNILEVNSNSNIKLECCICKATKFKTF